MNKRIFNKFTFVWCVAGIIMFILMMAMLGDARVINYSGIVRGDTQRLIKDELIGCENNELILNLDELMHELKTGDGKYNLIIFQDEMYQRTLDELTATWKDIKESIDNHRHDSHYASELYRLSEQHFQQANTLVSRAEAYSNLKLIRFIGIYLVTTIICVGAFILLENYNKRSIKEILLKDRLTGALTPIAFVEEANKIIQEDKKTQYAMVEFDIIKFKKINIVFGYVIGNAIICSISKALSDENILHTRVTSDEFLALIEYDDHCIKILQNILSNASRNMENDKLSYAKEVLFRYGITLICDEDDAIKRSMEKAHSAHKLAKIEGKSEVWCDEQLIQQLDKESFYEKHFSTAIHNKEFQIYLQPQVHLHTGEIIGAESLVRWRLSTGEIIFPDEFIPFFEKKGLIKVLDYYMLEETCRYIRQQMDLRNKIVPISINFSRVTLSESHFYQDMMDIVKSYDIPTVFIGIEIVETALNHMSQHTLDQLNKLKESGFKLSMDDFGVGYSSLNVLTSLPVNVIKLDKQFLWSIEDNDKIKYVIASIVNMAHDIGLEVICEGVETKEHVEYLCSIGCECAQGYYYSKPMPKEEFNLEG